MLKYRCGVITLETLRRNEDSSESLQYSSGYSVITDGLLAGMDGQEAGIRLVMGGRPCLAQVSAG
jgi:hypothetical protein